MCEKRCSQIRLKINYLTSIIIFILVAIQFILIVIFILTIRTTNNKPPICHSTIRFGFVALSGCLKSIMFFFMFN